jgi:hypothetical protein
MMADRRNPLSHHDQGLRQRPTLALCDVDNVETRL